MSKLNCDMLLSTSAFKFNLRCYTVAKDELQGCHDAGFADVTTKPLKRDLCREILERHGHTLLVEESPGSPYTSRSGAAAAAAVAAASNAASVGVPSGGAASGGAKGGGAAKGGLTGGGLASLGLTGGVAPRGGGTGGGAASGGVTSGGATVAAASDSPPPLEPIPHPAPRPSRHPTRPPPLHTHTLTGTAFGKAVQVDPVKPKLKTLGTKRLKLQCDILLSTSAFKFNLRRYNPATTTATTMAPDPATTRTTRMTRQRRPVGA